MLCLRCTHYVENRACAHALNTVNDTPEVRGGVVIPTITLTNNQWQRLILTVGKSFREDNLRTITLYEQTRIAQSIDNNGQQVVVGALPHKVIVCEQHIELCVHLVEVASAFLHQCAPQAHGVVVTTLQHHDTMACASLEFIRGFKLAACLLVETIKVANAQFMRCILFTKIDEMLNQHAEWSTPVANVVLANDCVSNETHNSHECIANHG